MNAHLKQLSEARRGKPSPVRGRKFPVEILTPDEVRSLLKKCNPRCATGCRNRALLALLYRGMLRISEALSLHPRDIDLATGTVNVRSGKGSKQRIVGIDPGACALIQLWLDRRARLGVGNQLPIFVTLHGAPLKSGYVRDLLKRLATKAGISKRTHPHGFRHAGAVELVSEGMDLVTIGQQLGHASVATTHRYVSHIAPQQLVAAMNQRNWEL